MKKIILLLLFVAFNSYAQDCRVVDEVSEILLIDCGSHKELNLVYLRNGTSIKLSKTNGRFYKVDKTEANIDIGEVLFIQDPILNHAVEGKQNQIKFRIFQELITYSHSNLKVQIPNTSGDLNNKDDNFETLPLRMVFDFEFEDFGVLLMPDFESKSGKIGFYKKVEQLGLGIFAGTNITNSREIVNNTTSKSSDKNLNAGFFVRYIGDQTAKWHNVARAYIGYVEIEEKDSPDEVTVKALLSGFDFHMYFRATKYLSLGFGVGTEYLNGTMDIKDSTQEIDTNMNNLTIILSPLLLQAHF